jgi:hypothetical protein
VFEVLVESVVAQFCNAGKSEERKESRKDDDSETRHRDSEDYFL